MFLLCSFIICQDCCTNPTLSSCTCNGDMIIGTSSLLCDGLSITATGSVTWTTSGGIALDNCIITSQDGDITMNGQVVYFSGLTEVISSASTFLNADQIILVDSNFLANGNVDFSSALELSARNVYVECVDFSASGVSTVGTAVLFQDLNLLNTGDATITGNSAGPDPVINFSNTGFIPLTYSNLEVRILGIGTGSGIEFMGKYEFMDSLTIDIIASDLQVGVIFTGAISISDCVGCTINSL